MIGKKTFFVNANFPRRCGELGRHQLVVDTPSNVMFTRPPAVRPPGILVGSIIDGSEGVDETDLVDDVIHPGALLRRKTRILLIAAPIFNVDDLVSDVDVAADDMGPRILDHRLHPALEAREKSKLRLLARIARRTRRKISARDDTVCEVSLDMPALSVEFRIAVTANDFTRLLTRIQCHSAVARLFGRKHESMEAAQMKLAAVDLVRLSLELLHAEHVRALA